MNVNINFYGHSVDVDPQAVFDRLPENPTKDDIKRAVAAEIAEILAEEMPEYTDDSEDVVERVEGMVEDAKAENASKE